MKYASRGSGHCPSPLTQTCPPYSLRVQAGAGVRTKVVKSSKRTIYAGRLRLQVVKDRSAKALETFVTESVEPQSHLITDGWIGYDGLSGQGYEHKPVVLSGDPEKTDTALPMIHLVFSNLKAWILGTHHGVSQQHLQAYLNEFIFNFNRRFHPITAFNSLLGIAPRGSRLQRTKQCTINK